MKKIFPLFLILFFYVCNIQAQPYGAPITIRGLADCGKWVSARAMQPSAAYFETAIQGYINGIVMASGIDVWNWNGSRMSEQQAFLYVDNYCHKHPLEDIWQASWMLVNEKTNNALINQARKRGK
jgi:hypothetical protein